MGSIMTLLDEILEKDLGDLMTYVEDKCAELEIEFDPEMLDLFRENPVQAMYDFIADNIHPELQGELHSECQLEPGCSMFPNSKDEEDLAEEMEHNLFKD